MRSFTFLQTLLLFIRRSCGESGGELTRLMLKLHGKDGLSENTPFIAYIHVSVFTDC